MPVTVSFVQCDGCGRRIEAIEVPRQWYQISRAAGGSERSVCSISCFAFAEGRVPRNIYAVNRFGLAPRDIEILELIAQGRSNAQIGLALGISGRSVRNRLTVNCVRSLGASSRVELVLLADRYGLIDLREQAAKIALKGV